MVKFLSIMSAILLVITVACEFSSGGSFGVLFFGALFVFCILLIICDKVKKGKSKFRKIFKVFDIILKSFFIVWFISFILIESLIFSGKYTDDISPDCVIILGAGVNGNVPSYTLKLRLDKAFEILEENPEAIAITTGAKSIGDENSESYVSKEYLVGLGIDESRIFLEEKSTDTYQNIKFAKEILGEDYNGNTIAVSNDFHLYRARSLLALNDLTPYGAEISLGNQFIGLDIIYNIREYFSIMKHWIFEVGNADG